MKNNKIRLYVVMHKKWNLSAGLKEHGYTGICVGNCSQAGMGNDRTGENIADKNANYCELTAQYWIWKNDTDSRIRGLCHYRRYFTEAAVSQNEKYFLKEKRIEQYLNQGYEAILPYKSHFITKAKYNYLRCGKKKDLRLVRLVIAQKYPAYLEEFDYVMNHNWSWLTNMMVTTQEVWDEYCQWLFDILFTVESRNDISGYTREEARVYGYLSERLLTVWILHNDIKVKEIRTVNVEEKYNVFYIGREFMIRLGIYQILKDLLWKLGVKKR